METQKYFEKYKMIKAVEHLKLKSDITTLKLQRKKRKNAKAPELFLTEQDKYLTGLYPINQLTQSIDLDSLQGGYTGDVNGVKICLYIKGNEAILLEYEAYKPKQKKKYGK
jgi:hypothetical protein